MLAVVADVSMFTMAYHALCNPFVMIVYRSPLGAIRYAQSVCSYR